MIVVKTFNDEIVKQEINPAYLKQFKKAGWVEFQEPKKVISEYEVNASKEEVVITETVTGKEIKVDANKNKGGRPKSIKQ